ncbi:hypothetical protein M426DRAFT_17098 [Hypoxylon sp. CI-4A]|nr:hypothetical protein M426DRAFT_17098 [Hypoxylon sp. CI-4A]
MDEGEIEAVAQEATKTLHQCFSQDNRFIYRECVASGTYGSAHRVQYVHNDRGYLTAHDFLVKKAHTSWDAEYALKEERNYLQQLRGGMHIVQLVDVPNNPLVGLNYPGEWLVMEWLGNGTLARFIHRAGETGHHLPNRLLWRFFLCLVRGSCAMAWPRGRTDNLTELETPIPGVPPGGMFHNDMHCANVLLADLGNGGEHGITPILKLIDFGNSTIAEPGDETTARGVNLWDIGKIMLKLITLDLGAEEVKLGDATQVNYLGMMIPTRANVILPEQPHGPSPYPWLDDWLATCVALCMIVEDDHMPPYQTLISWLLYAVVNRDENFYRGRPDETDRQIFEGCKQLLMDAPT